MDIGVGATSRMVDALLGKLAKLLQDEYALLSGSRSDFVFLQTELSRVRAAIQRCESLEDCDQQSRAWINRVRELAYDIDDWVDLFGTSGADAAGAGGSSNPNPSSSTGFTRSFSWIRRGVDRSSAALPERRHAIADELQRFKERAVELSERRNRYSRAALNFPTMARARPVDARLAPPLFVDTWSLVGLDRPVKNVSRMVTSIVSGALDVKVISIVGMAGSGKTTLAAAVYQQIQQQNCFDCYCFVSLGGQEPGSLNKALENMLSQLGNKPRGGQDIGQLIRDTLQNKRYLIVVDDLSSREQWETISHWFPKNQSGSKIITTTRNNELAKDSSVGSRNIVYEINLLSDDDSKKLFLKNVFGTGLDCPGQLKKSCDKIMKRCGRLPLALVSVASILVHRRTEHEWSKFASDFPWSSGIEALEKVLNRCLNNLPAHLRTCLLYLSIFTEYNEVEVERLVRRWVAEGFIDKGSSTREETARRYLDELTIRNMMQLSDVIHDGGFQRRYCKIHPVIHDFIVCKSMEENFVTLVDDAQPQHNQHAPNKNSTVRRLSVKRSTSTTTATTKTTTTSSSGGGGDGNSSGGSGSRSNSSMVPNESTTDLSHARSITVFGHADTTLELPVMEVVRVVDLEGFRALVSLDGLSKLLRLRYLSLKGTDIRELPETVGDLRCLETLDVRSTKVEKLPSSIARLEKLKHLLSERAKPSSGIMAKMKALQTLSCPVATQSCTDIIQEISRHDELRELELFAGVTEMPEVENRVIFPRDAFQALKELHIRCSFAASVTFEPNVLPRIEVLELRFEGCHVDESSSMSGIENLPLPSLKRMHIEFVKHDKGSMATVCAVKKAAGSGDNRAISIKVSGKSCY